MIEKLKKQKIRYRNQSNRTNKHNIRWLEQNYTEVAKCYDLKLKKSDYNSNRNQDKNLHSSPSGDPTLQMASNITRTSTNPQKQSTNIQNRKMFNNFLDSLDIATNAAVNSNVQLNTGYQQRTKSGSSHAAKLQAQQNQAIRQMHNNTV